MQKVVISPYRYSALLYTSSVLDYNTDVVVIFDEDKEVTPVDWLCYEALSIQKRFETEKAYKQFGVKKLYYFGTTVGDIIDIERVIVQLQLLVSVTGIKTLYFENDDFCYDTDICTLHKICSGLKGVTNKVVYSTDCSILGRGGIFVNLDAEQLEKKKKALEKMRSLKFFLMNCKNSDVEYFLELTN